MDGASTPASRATMSAKICANPDICSWRVLYSVWLHTSIETESEQ
jgi:hypothetical protein